MGDRHGRQDAYILFLVHLKGESHCESQRTCVGRGRVVSLHAGREVPRRTDMEMNSGGALRK